MNERQYEEQQSFLDKYADYMIEKIKNKIEQLPINELEELMDILGLYNRYWE